MVTDSRRLFISYLSDDEIATLEEASNILVAFKKETMKHGAFDLDDIASAETGESVSVHEIPRAAAVLSAIAENKFWDVYKNR